MTTIHITDRVDIDRPASEVWAIVADYSIDPQWRHGVLAMTPSPPGPVREGTITAEELRMLGRTWHNDGEVLAVVAGRSFTWRTTKGADARGRRSVLELDPSRCRVELELTVQPHGAERLLRPLLARLLRANLSGDLARLRALAAGATGAGGPAVYVGAHN